MSTELDSIKEKGANIERSSGLSPFTSQDISVKEYSTNLIGGGQTPQPPQQPTPPQQPQQTIEKQQQTEQIQNNEQDYDLPDPNDVFKNEVKADVEPDPFSFNQETDDDVYSDDTTEVEQAEKVEVPKETIKDFVDVIVEAGKEFLPKLTHNYAKIDETDAQIQVKEGHLQPQYLQAIQQINQNTFESLQITEGEAKLLKKSLYIIGKNTPILAKASGSTAGYLGLVTFGAGQFLKIKGVKKQNEEYFKHFMYASNPAYAKKIFEQSEAINENSDNSETKNEQ